MTKGLERIETKVRQFQRKLYLKAKQERGFRFYILYDKIHRWDILLLSWRRVKKNGGSPGIDGQTIDDIERHGVESFLKQLQSDLQERTYKPEEF